MIYLDWAATARPDPAIIDAMAAAALEYPGNPSSPYPEGKAARAALEEARQRCADVLEVAPETLVFTSGGTEANNIVLMSRLLTREPGTILISGLEHPSTAEPARALSGLGWTVKDIPPEPDGRISPARAAYLLEKNPDTRLVAVMGVNNEIGAVMPLAEIAAEIRRYTGSPSRRPIHFHADLVQTAGKADFTFSELDVDSAAFAAHKIRGPRGVGLLYHRNPKFEAFLRGGGQEHGVRPGTENVAGAVAMALSLEKWGRPDTGMTALGRKLLDGLMKVEGAEIVPAARAAAPGDESPPGHPHYVPAIIAAAFPPIPGEVLARVLAESGYAVSTGSACSNNKKGKLPKSMAAMKVPKDIATGMIRVSIGSETTEEDINGFLETLEGHVKVLRLVNRRR